MKLCQFSVVLILIITSCKGMADAMLPDYMCTYPLSHDREAPEWEFFRIDNDFLREDNATKETCWDYCNKAENCRSAQLIIHDDGRRYCYRYNISVQELKDTGRYLDIFTQTNRDEYPTYITYDRDCAECTYPVSHAWQAPNWDIYEIDKKYNNMPTFKTCQAWCNEDVFCRSVLYTISGDVRYCHKFSISLQELKDSGRYNEIYNIGISSYITYDKQCAAPPSIMCFNTYPVSHAWESPYSHRYFIDEERDDNPTLKTCQEWCTEDVNCRSVAYRILGDYRYCYKYSISLQELKDSGRYKEIYNFGISSAITYDKQCVEVSPTTKGPGKDGDEVSPATREPGKDGDEVSPATREPGTNAAAIAEPMIVLIVMIGAGAVFLAPMLPGAEIAF